MLVPEHTICGGWLCAAGRQSTRIVTSPTPPALKNLCAKLPLLGATTTIEADFERADKKEEKNMLQRQKFNINNFAHIRTWSFGVPAPPIEA